MLRSRLTPWLWPLLLLAGCTINLPAPAPAPSPAPAVVPSSETEQPEAGSVAARTRTILDEYERDLAASWQELADNPPASAYEMQERAGPKAAAAIESARSKFSALIVEEIGDSDFNQADAKVFFAEMAKGGRRK